MQLDFLEVFNENIMMNGAGQEPPRPGRVYYYNGVKTGFTKMSVKFRIDKATVSTIFFRFYFCYAF